MYDVRPVRQSCEEIAIEQDYEKAEVLIKLLSAMMREKDEEIAFNLAVVRSKYCLTYNRGSIRQVSGGGS